jgi:hypothetical protein
MLTLCMLASGPAQSLQWQDDFNQACRGCWPNWVEITKPICGTQPRVINGMGFLFINGCNTDPTLNREHMLFSPDMNTQAEIFEVAARFKFSNAANGGKLLSRGGGYRCLGSADVMNFVTNELLIVTLRDDGTSWYGAFIGDYNLLQSEYVPSPESHDTRSYSTIGLLRNSTDGLQTLAMTIIPSVRRFAAIDCNVRLQTSSAWNDLLEVTFAIQNGGTYTLTAEAEQVFSPTGTQAGFMYFAGQGSPCTNLPQREIAVDSFQVRF